jgi:hypothetical protein
MKRGLILSLLLIILLFSIHSASALSIGDIIQSEWANAAIIFLLVFNVVLMVFRNFFKSNYGAAIIIAIIIAFAGSLGVVYYFGAFLGKLGLWLAILFVVAIALLVSRFGKGKGIIVFIILGLASILWLAFGHSLLCRPLGTLPFNVCQILDVIAFVILIACFLRFLFWLLGRARKSGEGIFNRGGRDGGKNKEPLGDGQLRGYVEDQHGNRIEATISITGKNFAGQSIPTDPNGNFHMDLPGGSLFRPITYQVTASKPGYSSETKRTKIVSKRGTKLLVFRIHGHGPDKERRTEQPFEPSEPRQPEIQERIGIPRIRLYVKYKNNPYRKIENIHRGEKVLLGWVTRNAKELFIPGIIHTKDPMKVRKYYMPTHEINGKIVFKAYAINEKSRKLDYATVNIIEDMKQEEKKEEISTEKLRKHYEQLYLQKKKEKERIQKELNNYYKQKKHLEDEINKFKKGGLHAGGQEHHLEDVNRKVNNFLQKLRILDSELNELTRKMPRYK